MTPDGWRVADSDMHVFEPPDLWQRYIAPAWRHAAPIGLSELRRDMRVKVKYARRAAAAARMRPSRPVDAWKAPQEDAVLARPRSTGWSPESQMERWTTEGLDVAVLFPTRGLFVLGLDT